MAEELSEKRVQQLRNQKREFLELLTGMDTNGDHKLSANEQAAGVIARYAAQRQKDHPGEADPLIEIREDMKIWARKGLDAPEAAVRLAEKLHDFVIRPSNIIYELKGNQGDLKVEGNDAAARKAAREQRKDSQEFADTMAKAIEHMSPEDRAKFKPLTETLTSNPAPEALWKEISKLGAEINKFKPENVEQSLGAQNFAHAVDAIPAKGRDGR